MVLHESVATVKTLAPRMVLVVVAKVEVAAAVLVVVLAVAAVAAVAVMLAIMAAQVGFRNGGNGSRGGGGCHAGAVAAVALLLGFSKRGDARAKHLVQAHQRALKVVRAAGVETAAVGAVHMVVLAAASVVVTYLQLAH